MDDPRSESRSEFRDRSRGLAVFGAIAISVGALATCFAALTPIVTLAAGVPGHAGITETDPRGLVIGTVFYVAIAILFVTLGVGSLRLRRWVRPLMLVVGWGWLACGVLALASWLILLPTFPASMRAARPADPPIPDEVMKVVTLIASLFLLAAYIALPSLFVWFYHDRDVARTLERADPVPRWTDRCPLPVLGMSSALVVAGAAALVPLPYGAVPAFGRILTGAPAALFCAALAASAAVLAWASYRLRVWAWWGTLALALVVHVGSLAAFLRVDMVEIYERMEMPPQSIALLREGGVLTASVAILSTAALGVASVIYLLFVRRYFLPGGPGR